MLHFFATLYEHALNIVLVVHSAASLTSPWSSIRATLSVDI